MNENRYGPYFVNFKEWDGAFSRVTSYLYPLVGKVLLLYADGTRHLVEASYYRANVRGHFNPNSEL